MNYHDRPDLPIELFAEVTNTLAHWLTVGQESDQLFRWSEDEWRAAEWVTYWQSAQPWFVKQLKQSAIMPPQEIWQRMCGIDVGSRARTSQFFSDTGLILNTFKEQGIRALPLKGAVLAPLYYTDPEMRPFGDIDIYIDHGSMDAADRIMKQLGYSFFKRTAKDNVYLIGTRDYHNVWAASNVRPVEIQHQALNEYGGISYDMHAILWEQTEQCDYWGGYNLTVPSKVGLMHHICAHATEDWLLRRGKLMQLYDLQVLTAQLTEQDWEQFLKTVTPAASRFVFPALATCQRYTSASVPDEVLTWLHANTSEQLQAWMLTTPPGEMFERREEAVEWAELRIGNLLARSSWEKLRVMLRLIFPPRWHFRLKEYDKLIQSPLWPLAYLRLNLDRVRQIAR